MSDFLTILSAGHARRLNHCVDKYYKDYWSFQYMDAGHIEVAYDDTKYTMKGKWFWTAYPGPRARIIPQSREGWVHSYVSFKGALLERWQDAGLLFSVPQECPGHKDYGRLMHDIVALALSKDRLDRIQSINLLEALLIELAQIRRSSRMMNEAWLTTATVKLNQNVAVATDYQALAAQCGMSLSSLRQKFRKHMGISLHAYALQARIQEAKMLLSHTDIPIKAIAERLGYNDVGFFTRQFHRFAGITPAAFRDTM